jgi:hypothetical protein
MQAVRNFMSTTQRKLNATAMRMPQMTMTHHARTRSPK